MVVNDHKQFMSLSYCQRYAFTKMAQNLTLVIFGQHQKVPPALKSSYLSVTTPLKCYLLDGQYVVKNEEILRLGMR